MSGIYIFQQLSYYQKRNYEKNVHIKALSVGRVFLNCGVDAGDLSGL